MKKQSSKQQNITKEDRRLIDIASVAVFAGLITVGAINYFVPMGQWVFLSVICVHVFVVGWIHGTMGVYARRMSKVIESESARLRTPGKTYIH